MIYILLSILGLSFLIFIHELGHYWMARREGMRVETFSIGFGRPIYSWKFQETTWQIGWLLFGGYVKIAGMDLEKSEDPYKEKDGFFSKSPWARIKVALMGPVANLLFALLAFAMLWVSGGREKRFSETTHKIGWVDPESALYKYGVRPGDEISAYDTHPYETAKDHLYAAMTENGEIPVEGYKINYTTGEREPFSILAESYPHPDALDEGIRTLGVLQPAGYLVYQKPTEKQQGVLQNSPLLDSGIQNGDRLLWANGEILFSLKQLHYLLNQNRALVTVQRGDNVVQVRVPRVALSEIKPEGEFRDEMIDWQYEAGLSGLKPQELMVLPYNLTSQAVVQAPVKFIDRDKASELWPETVYSAQEEPLKVGDKILAVYGIAVDSPAKLLKELQDYRINVVVQRTEDSLPVVDPQEADRLFEKEIAKDDLEEIVSTLGTANSKHTAGQLVLLAPVAPKLRKDLALMPEAQKAYTHELQEQKKAIDAMSNPQQRIKMQRQLDLQEKSLYIGLTSFPDRKVKYNPTPFGLFKNVFDEIKTTLQGLISGVLNPKWLVGPIGIVQIVHDSTTHGLKEALFWLGAISLNLGVLNLLPIPMLDGGTIIISLVEMVTGKRMHPRLLEKLVLVFGILFVLFFLFITYHDLTRLLK